MAQALALPIALLYSELNDLAAEDRYQRQREGSYSVKTIKNKRYWYHQIWVGPHRIQKLIGAESPELLENIRSQKLRTKDWRAQKRRREQIVRSLKAALRMNVDPITGRVIARLSELGIFAAGAVLVGTHAYMTYGPMLGVKLIESNLRTGDIDFAAVNVASNDVEASFADAVLSADNAFFVIPPRVGSRISTALKYRGSETRVELLTPLKSGKPWQPEIIKSLKFGAQRTPYLDYLLEKTVDATYLGGAGVHVRVPHPAWFACHKLIVAANRDVGAQTKSLKDITQAAELFRALRAISRSDDIQNAASKLKQRGDRYVRKAIVGARRISDQVLRGEILELFETK